MDYILDDALVLDEPTGFADEPEATVVLMAEERAYWTKIARKRGNERRKEGNCKTSLSKRRSLLSSRLKYWQLSSLAQKRLTRSVSVGGGIGRLYFLLMQDLATP